MKSEWGAVRAVKAEPAADEKITRAAADRKAPIRLIPYHAVVALSRAMEYGAAKYAKDNWKNARTDPEAKYRYAEAAIRHAFAIINGEDIDPESGLPHWSHLLACGAIGSQVDPVTMGQDFKPELEKK